MKSIKKPPIGLTPKWVRQTERLLTLKYVF